MSDIVIIKKHHSLSFPAAQAETAEDTAIRKAYEASVANDPDASTRILPSTS